MIRNRINAWVHKWHVAELLRAIRRWLADWNAMDEYHVLLSPKILSKYSKDNIEKYRYTAVRELRNAIDSEGCNNIAITGVYGSGKSSVIQTYLAELHPYFRKRRVLSISLSNFIDSELLEKDTIKYEDEIEQKIFQHILYKANQNKTRQTSYNRISHISISRGILIAIFILLGVLSVLYLFFPSVLRFENLLQWYRTAYSSEVRHAIHFYGEVVAVLYLLLSFVYCVAFAIRRFHNVRIKGKVEAKGAQLDWTFESSTFNKLLDEILYFFKAGGYRIVLFEDLDRIKTPERLFLKLREINTLLNESDYFKRRKKSIKFVYAIRDEIFSSEIRTKCFDYIISVVPVVDKYNSGDYLIKQYHKTIMSGISERDLSVIGMYIGSKRELANVVNEYALCHKAFIHDTSETKLLALLVYKNLFPMDYAAAYKKEGCLCAVLSNDNRHLFYYPLIDELVQKEEMFDKQIKQDRETIRKCRKQVFDVLAADNIEKLYIGSEEYALSEFVENEQLYEAFANNRITKYFWSDGHDCATSNYDKKFLDLVEAAFPDDSYESFMYGAQGSLRMNLKEKGKIHNQIEIIKNKKLSGLVRQLGSTTAIQIIETLLKSFYEKKYENADDYADLVKRHKEFLHLFIKEEYIAEDYSSYMSHSYPGSLSEEDMRFVNAVLQGNALEYGYGLTNCEAILSRFQTENYEHESILNNALVDYLFAAKKEMELKCVILTARKNPQFVKQYYNAEYGEQFVKMLFTEWQGAITQIMNMSDPDDQISMIMRYWDAAPHDVRILDSEEQTLEDMYSYISGAKTTENLMEMIESYDLKFNKLEHPDTEIFDYVTRTGHFAITLENLRVIYGEKFDSAAFTQIYSQREDVRLYILEHVNTVISFAPEPSVNETPETIVALLNDLMINVSTLIPYIKKQKSQIDSADIQHEERVYALLETNVMRPTWENVDSCFGKIRDTKLLVEYVQRNIDILSQNKFERKHIEAIEDLLLVESTQLSDGEYDKLVPCFTMAIDAVNLKGLSEHKIRMLNANDLLYFDDATIEYVYSVSKKLFAEYLLMNFEEFLAKDEMPVDITNEIGAEILKSHLTLGEKSQYMSYYPVEKDKDGDAEYAELYCFYANQLGNINGVNIDDLLVAMKLYGNGIPEAWKVKISLINKINRIYAYSKEREEKLIDTLDEYYSGLNRYGHHVLKFDRNPENEELLNYLKENEHYVSDVKETIMNKLKVTFRHK